MSAVDVLAVPVEFFSQLPIPEEKSYLAGEVRAVVIIGGDRHSAHGATFAEAAANLIASLARIGGAQ